jgi:hypothetical protein
VNDKKKDYPIQHGDIHTIVDMPLELVSQYLMDLPEDYEVSIKEKDADEASFLIKTKHLKELYVVESEGTIRRWNGTLTRLDADIRVVKSNDDPRTIPLILFALGIIIPVVLPLFFAPKVFEVSASNGALILIFAVMALIFIPISFVLFDSTKNSLNAKKAKHPKVYRALMEDLEDDLSKKLKEKADILRFDGTEDNLAELLQEAEFKHFRLGADGEIASP